MSFNLTKYSLFTTNLNAFCTLVIAVMVVVLVEVIDCEVAVVFVDEKKVVGECVVVNEGVVLEEEGGPGV